MTEPEYEYRYTKGAGWILSPALDQETFTVAGLTITLLDRVPNDGEYFFSNTTIEELKAIYIDHFVWRIKENTMLSATPIWGPQYHYQMNRGGIVTVIYHV